MAVLEEPSLPHLAPSTDIDDPQSYLRTAIDMAHARLLAFEVETLGTERSRYRDVVAGQAVDGILSQAAAGQAETIVVGSHGRTGLSRFLLGSVSEAIVASSPIDVLVVR